jgi:hypothetical protein
VTRVGNVFFYSLVSRYKRTSVVFEVMTKYAALLFALASSVVCAFQVALAFGAPWGEFTLGGRWRGSLPPKVRLVPLFSLVLLVGFAAVIVARANIAFPLLHEQSRHLAWVVVSYCALGSFANSITPSKRERNLWLPIVLLMLASSTVVALS